MKKALLIMTSILSMVSSLFAGGNEYITAEIYDSMRNQVLNLTPNQLGEFRNNPVICLLMETGYPELYLKVVFKGKGGVSTGRLLAAVNRPH